MHFAIESFWVILFRSTLKKHYEVCVVKIVIVIGKKHLLTIKTVNRIMIHIGLIIPQVNGSRYREQLV